MLRIVRFSDCECFDFEKRTSLTLGKSPLTVEAGADERILISCERSKRSVRVGEVFYLGSEFFLLLSDGETWTTLHDAQGLPPKLCSHVTSSLGTFCVAIIRAIQSGLWQSGYRSLRQNPRDTARAAVALLALLTLLSGGLSGSMAEAPERDETPTNRELLYALVENLVHAAPPPEPLTSGQVTTSDTKPVEESPQQPQKKKRDARRVGQSCHPGEAALSREARAFMTPASLHQLDSRQKRQCSR
jgi:hypothetical protein